MPRTQTALYLAAAVAVVLLGARYVGADRSAAPSQAAPPVRVERARPVAALVHVAGAVRRPGVYRMRPGARIDDAVRQAGGATARADLSAVNLAAEVDDGRQVVVPERAPRGAVASGGDDQSPVASPVPGQPLNLNTATLEQLDTLAGVGPATAQKILDFREEHGGFGSVDELARVPGIGEKRLASLKEQVRV